MKLFPLLIIPFLLVGCAVFYPQPKQPVLQDQQDFCQAFTEFQNSRSITGFQKLLADFPESIWSARAETIILYAQELDRQKGQNEELHNSVRQQSLDLEQLTKLNHQLNDENEHLRELNQQLADKIEQLKSLLIQSEKHPR